MDSNSRRQSGPSVLNHFVFFDHFLAPETCAPVLSIKGRSRHVNACGHVRPASEGGV